MAMQHAYCIIAILSLHVALHVQGRYASESKIPTRIFTLPVGVSDAPPISLSETSLIAPMCDGKISLLITPDRHLIHFYAFTRDLKWIAIGFNDQVGMVGKSGISNAVIFKPEEGSIEQYAIMGDSGTDIHPHPSPLCGNFSFFQNTTSNFTAMSFTRGYWNGNMGDVQVNRSGLTIVTCAVGNTNAFDPNDPPNVMGASTVQFPAWNGTDSLCDGQVFSYWVTENASRMAATNGMSEDSTLDPVSLARPGGLSSPKDQSRPWSASFSGFDVGPALVSSRTATVHTSPSLSLHVFAVVNDSKWLGIGFNDNSDMQGKKVIATAVIAKPDDLHVPIQQYAITGYDGAHINPHPTKGTTNLHFIQANGSTALSFTRSLNDGNASDLIITPGVPFYLTCAVGNANQFNGTDVPNAMNSVLVEIGKISPSPPVPPPPPPLPLPLPLLQANIRLFYVTL